MLVISCMFFHIQYEILQFSCCIFFIPYILCISHIFNILYHTSSHTQYFFFFIEISFYSTLSLRNKIKIFHTHYHHHHSYYISFVLHVNVGAPSAAVAFHVCPCSMLPDTLRMYLPCEIIFLLFCCWALVGVLFSWKQHQQHIEANGIDDLG